MNKPNSIHQFSVFNRFDYYCTDRPSKLIQILTLKFIGGRVWLNTSTNKEITLRPTNDKGHYLAIGKDKKDYLLFQMAVSSSF